jgi:pyruvate dehydrogenase E1 component beta subunit
MVIEAIRAGEELEKQGYDIEIIDPRTLKPLDEEIILDSIKKTGRLIIADCDWKTCGIGSEIAAIVSEKGFRYLKAPIARIALPDIPTPSSHVLEEAFYPGKKEIIDNIKEIVKR